MAFRERKAPRVGLQLPWRTWGASLRHDGGRRFVEARARGVTAHTLSRTRRCGARAFGISSSSMFVLIGAPAAFPARRAPRVVDARRVVGIASRDARRCAQTAVGVTNRWRPGRRRRGRRATRRTTTHEDDATKLKSHDTSRVSRLAASIASRRVASRRGTAPRRARARVPLDRGRGAFSVTFWTFW